ncbi:class I SAM-dependent methyltransferase [Microlunatus sp. GCM10028923]|uniref:class I SAM-dependent methyltransferase n=1 Tax=Microlunatus sp. GCM10028923 TaxID=3273400 RepID=UPI003605E775
MTIETHPRLLRFHWHGSLVTLTSNGDLEMSPPLDDRVAPWSVIADQYDTINDSLFPADLDRLDELLADRQSVCELASGTGRAALRLARPGRRVVAVDFSSKMLNQLRQKDIQGSVQTVCQPMEDYVLQSADRFSAVVCINNGITYLTSADEQLALLRSLPNILLPGGIVVIECADPSTILFNWAPSPKTMPVVIRHDMFLSMSVSLNFHDQLARISYAYEGSGKQTRRTTTVSRYIWPNEFRLMCELSGLSILNWWGTWNGEDYTSGSPKMIAVLCSIEDTDEGGPLII